MNKPQAFLGSALLALSAALAGLAGVPAAALAGGDHYCPSYKPCYTPDYCHHCPEPYCPPCHHDYCCPTYCPPSYHYEYCDCRVKTPYTCYDECGHPYTAYRYETVQKKVKVSD